MARSLLFTVMDNGMGLVRTGYASNLIKAFMTGAFNYTREDGTVEARKMGTKAYSYPYPDGCAGFAANDFLESEFDEWLIIDGDIIFQPGHIQAILSHDLPIVCGMYPKKKPGLEWCIDLLPGTDFPKSTPFEEPLMEILHCARGFMKIQRGVFEALAKTVPQYDCPEAHKKRFEFWKNYSGGHSDDYNFCDLARAAGFKTMLDRRCQLMHEGASIFPIPGTY